MCVTCWADYVEEYSDDTIRLVRDADHTKDLQTAIRNWYGIPFNGRLIGDHGGPMHAELDDWNIDGTITKAYVDEWAGLYDELGKRYKDDSGGHVAEMIKLWNPADELTRAVALASHEGWADELTIKQIRADLIARELSDNTT